MENKNFQLALQWIFEAEGGYVDHPSDPGGATNLGISLRYLKTKGELADIDGDGDIDVIDIAQLTKPVAAHFYHSDYWLPCQCDELPGPLAIIVFDHAVNAGVRSASKQLQRQVGAKADGIIGPKTLAKVATVYYKSPAWFIGSFMARRAKFYHDITINKPSLSTFIKGWFNRLFLLNQFIVEHG